MSTTHHVIVGASIAGVSAAVSMREKGFDGSITIIEAENRQPYERPPLSKTADPESALRPLLPPDSYSAKQIDLRLGTTVERLDVDRRRVVLGDGDELRADLVLLATGVSARRLGVPGEDLDHVLTLRNADDASRIFSGFSSGGPLVIVGGGFIGLEAAAVARTMGIDVTVVETEELPLLRPLGRSAAELMMELHRQHGVRVLTNHTVAAFLGTTAVEQVQLTGGETLPAASVIVGCGVVPNDELASAAGVYCDGGVVVDVSGRTSNPWIWAAGDVANQPHPHVARRERIEHWDVALRHGTAVGASMVGHVTENSELPYFWSDQYGLTLQAYGRGRPGDRIVLREGATPDRFVAFWLRNGYLAAVAGLAETKSVRAAKKLVEARAAISPAVLADPSTNLRELTRNLASKPAVTV
ncbi:MAG: FAD-dependent oxidoreductase [Rhodococcus sp. (in: high G+C Gram-positive bacteria)]